MQKVTPHRHDRFFKGTFSDLATTSEFLQAFLPAEVLKKIDLDTLVLESTNYVDEQLSVYYSDLVWNVSYRKSTVKIAFLFEHKTVPSYDIYRQLLRYILQMLDIQAEDNRLAKRKDKRYTPIIPIVVYQSKKKWLKRPFSDYFKGIYKELMRYLPLFDYLRVDTSEEAEQLLQQKNFMRNYVAFKTMRHVAQDLLDYKNVLELVQEVFGNEETPESIDEEFNKRVLSYIFSNTDISAKDIWDDIHNLTSEKNEKMSTLNQFIAMGKEEGIVLGEARGEARGKAEGKAEGKRLATQILKLYHQGYPNGAIAAKLAVALELVVETIEDYEAA